MTRRIIAASIGYVDSSSSPQAKTLYVATESFTTNSGDTPANTYFDGRLSGDIDFEFRVAAPYTKRKPVSGFGKLVISNADGEMDDALNWRFRDGSVVVKSLEVGQDWDDGTVLATTVGDRVQMSGFSDLVIYLRDPAAILEQPLQQEAFTTGDASGQLIPVSFGTPLNCKPVQVSYDTNRFDFHDDTVVDVATVRIDGLATVDYTLFSESGSSGIAFPSAPEGEVTVDPVATGTGSVLSITVDSPQDEGISFSNNNKTVQNENRLSHSPQTNIIWSGYANASKPMAAGGKYYFEAVIVRNNTTTSGTYFPDGRWGCAVGIGPVPTSSQDLSQADQYAAWTGQESVGDDIYTWRDGTNVDLDNIATMSSWDGGIIGVLVNFDDQEVTFKVNDTQYTSSVLAITVNSPQDTFYPLVAVSGSNAADNRNQDNKITLNLQPEHFAYDIPDGYDAWGESAYSASTKFSDLVASITARIPGLSVDSTTQTAIDDLDYSYSYYCADSQPAAQVLWEAVSGFTGWYYINRLGALSFGFLDQPQSGSVATFDDTEIIGVRSLEIDYARGLSTRMGGRRNWTVQNRGTLDATLDEETKDLLSRRYRHEVTDDTNIAEAYNHALNAEILGSYFRTDSNADDEIARLMGLFTDERRLLEIDVAFELSKYTSLYMGSPVSFDLSRYGFDDGKDQYILLGLKGSFAKTSMRMLVWGAWNSSSQVPAAPTSLTATADGQEIDLSWTDNASDETGYKIQRSNDVSPLSFTTIDTIAANSTSYTDDGSDLSPAGLSSGTTYYYRVIATNANGDSAPSNVDSATIEATDPYFDDVELLLHMDGSDGSTTFTDSSSNNYSPDEVGGDVQLDTEQKKFGTASAIFDGTGDYIAYNPAWGNIGAASSVWTIEGWFRFPSLASSQGLFFSGNTGSNENRVQAAIISGNLNLYLQPAFGSQTLNGSTTVTADTWHHLAFCRDETDLYIFLNGNLEDSTSSAVGTGAPSDFRIGQRRSGGQMASMTGWIDDFRITWGVCRYTSSFTPPNAPFPNS